ncbi:adhesion G protein-coupled receptor B1-like [Mytilus californianus]|uniref:adhesion G protein-coupled receptor B1-like n=1 Tax=Mytilus californianus TaxID=6549 RepID=UPI00224540E5|nr:adhesion G protein-coupled receptor B1-like [Mytilus californianus]
MKHRDHFQEPEDGKLQVGLTVNGPFYEDATLTFTCTADIIGSVGQISVTWTLNNSVLRPTSRSRWMIERLPPNPLMPFRVVYQIAVDPLKKRDSGSLSCSVTDGNLQSSRSIKIQVLGKPTVSIFPLTAAVKQGETITVQCTITSNPTEVRDIQWYRNGYMFDGSQDEVIEAVLERTSERLFNRNIQRSVFYECVGRNEAGDGPKVMSNLTVYVDGESLQICPANVDKFGTRWEETIDGIIVTKSCTGNQTGEVSRVCDEGKWGEPDYSTCVLKELVSIEEEADKLTEGVEKEVVDDILKKLTNVTKKENKLTSGDLTAASSVLLSVADHAKERVETVSSDQLEDFVEATNNILYDEKKEDWNQLKTKQSTGVTTVLKAIQNYNDAYSQSQDKQFKTIIQKDNLVVEIGKVQNEDITFPDRTQSQPSWIAKSKTTIKLQQSSLTGNQPLGFGTAYYRNISDLFPPNLLKNSEVQDIEGSMEVNSDVVDFSISPPLPYINPPLVIQFQYLDTELTKPVCGFWDYNAQAWSTVGSRLTDASDEIATCEYDHTTNFALLMSPIGAKVTGHEKALSYISAIGCGISILFLIITLVVYFKNWNRIRSDKAKILANLCIALILSYALFLCLWAPLSDIKALCITFAVVLHYIFLVDFSMMLAMAIEIGFQVLYVLPTKSRVKWLIPICWVAPTVIVGISMGATQLEGYGDTSDVCWLSVDNGLIWAFIGPALVIVLVNLVILVLVIRTLFRTMRSKPGRSQQSKSRLEKTKSGVRSICVLAPLFGVTWVFGVLSISRDLVVFQYLFAIFNSLQGFFIFVFHCLIDKKVKEAIKHHSNKRRAARLDSFSITESKSRKTSQTSDTNLTPKASPKISHSSVFTNDLKKTYDKDLNNNLNNKLPERKGSLLNKLGESVMTRNLSSPIGQQPERKGSLLNKIGESVMTRNQPSPIGRQLIDRHSASPKNQLSPANQQEGYNPFGRVQSPMRLSPGHQQTTPWQPNTADIGTI